MDIAQAAVADIAERPNVVTKPVTPKALRLDMGCGRNKQPGYIGVDTHEDADLRAPMWSVPLPDGCAEAIVSTHALEHVRKSQVVPTLKEWHRLLQPGGTLTLRVPDLLWCVNNWIRTGMGNGWELDTIFGSGEHEGNVHRTGFTVPMIRFYVEQAGFQQIAIRPIESHGQPTIELIAKRA